jgi:hypothetical protein
MEVRSQCDNLARGKGNGDMESTFKFLRSLWHTSGRSRAGVVRRGRRNLKGEPCSDMEFGDYGEVRGECSGEFPGINRRRRGLPLGSLVLRRVCSLFPFVHGSLALVKDPFPISIIYLVLRQRSPLCCRILEPAESWAAPQFSSLATAAGSGYRGLEEVLSNPLEFGLADDLLSSDGSFMLVCDFFILDIAKSGRGFCRYGRDSLVRVTAVHGNWFTSRGNAG